MLPFIGAAIAVSALVAWANSDDSSSSSSSTVSDQEEREDEAREEAKEKRNKKIKKDIKQYKKRQVKYFADKYGVDITFVSKRDIFDGALGPVNGKFMASTPLMGGTNKYKIRIVPVNADESTVNPIKELKEGNKKLSQLINSLEEMKGESIV